MITAQYATEPPSSLGMDIKVKFDNAITFKLFKILGSMLPITSTVIS